MIQGILFDFDGTIVDSEESRYESIKMILEEYGITFTRQEWDEHYKSIGTVPLLDEFKEKYSLEYNSEELYKKSHTYRESLEIQGVPVIEGFFDFYEKLKEKGIKVLIVSGGTTNHVQKVLEASGLPLIDFFGREEYVSRKPAPDSYLRGLEKIGLSPHEVLVFEDARTGMESAFSAGLRVISIHCTEDISDLQILKNYEDYTQIDVEDLLRL